MGTRRDSTWILGLPGFRVERVDAENGGDHPSDSIGARLDSLSDRSTAVLKSVKTAIQLCGEACPSFGTCGRLRQPPSAFWWCSPASGVRKRGSSKESLKLMDRCWRGYWRI